jgi:hypothetical protein
MEHQGEREAGSCEAGSERNPTREARCREREAAGWRAPIGQSSRSTTAQLRTRVGIGPFESPSIGAMGSMREL